MPNKNMAAGTEDISHVESADYLREHEAALVGAYVLPELSSHDEVANNSIRNVFRVTKGITLANSFLMCYLYFAGTMAYIVPPTQVSFMVADLGRPDLAAWVSTATSVGICAVLPVSGALTDVVGRRWAMIAGSLLGVAGSIVAGRADSTKMIIAGQVRLTLCTRSCTQQTDMIVVPRPLAVLPSRFALSHLLHLLKSSRRSHGPSGLLLSIFSEPLAKSLVPSTPAPSSRPRSAVGDGLSTSTQSSSASALLEPSLSTTQSLESAHLVSRSEESSGKSTLLVSSCSLQA